MLLFTEAHLEYNAGLVISIGSDTRRSPVRNGATAASLARELQEYRQTRLVSTARPPSTPCQSVVNGTMFTPFVYIGVPMQSALDLCVAWSMYGLYMCQNFWPRPRSDLEQLGPSAPVTWPRQSHPQALTQEGQKRTPWLTSCPEPPSSRAFCRCFPFSKDRAQLRLCRVSTCFKQVHCQLIACALPSFMPLAKPKLERSRHCEALKSKDGKPCLSPS